MPFELEKQKFEKKVENAKISLCTENFHASSDNLSVFSTESSVKDFNQITASNTKQKQFQKLFLNQN